MLTDMQKIKVNENQQERLVTNSTPKSSSEVRQFEPIYHQQSVPIQVDNANDGSSQKMEMELASTTHISLRPSAQDSNPK